MRYNQTGTVLEVDGEYVVWRSYQDNKKVVDNIHDLRKVNKMTMMSPVLQYNLTSNGTEFRFIESKELYSKQHPMYQKYNGQYHIHDDGMICAGPHDMDYVVPERLLKRKRVVIKKRGGRWYRRVFGDGLIPDRTTPRQTLRESEFFDTSCYGSLEDGDWTLYDWCIPVLFNWPQNYLYHFGNIYIEGILSTNPVDSSNHWADPQHNDFVPGYCMNGWNDETGNCDAVAAIHYSEGFPNGLILGFEFVNTQVVSGTAYPGFPMFIQHDQVGMGFPNLPIYIDDLVLYRANTGTYHKLTDESRARFINHVNPFQDAVVYGNPNTNEADLYFGPSLEEGQIPLPLAPIADCRTDEDCRQGLICHAGKCVSSTSAPIGRATSSRQQPPQTPIQQRPMSSFTRVQKIQNRGKNNE